MQQKRIIPFHITGMDSLGQGVSKLSEKVTFIPKTTIGDRGEALVVGEKKSVVFARILKLQEKSQLRIDPYCRHFNDCPSCHYQHVSYEEELKFKEAAFKSLFRKLPLPEVKVLSAPARFSYRNRIQLHYSLKTKLLGMLDSASYKIVPVPECKIALPEIETELKRLYTDNQWLREAPSAPMEGHVEIYWLNSKLQVNWNRPYAEGGFTQVYQLMNQRLKDELKSSWVLEGDKHLLDLFGGNGNLSEELHYSRRLCVDVYRNPPASEDFFNQDLYALDAISRVQKKIGTKVDNLLLDPPRSGLKNLAAWLEAFSPSRVAYVSCDPHTLVRDLAELTNYEISRAYLIDFFPSTFHFESMIFLERKR